jgi:hypothetical protein
MSRFEGFAANCCPLLAKAKIFYLFAIDYPNDLARVIAMTNTNNRISLKSLPYELDRHLNDVMSADARDEQSPTGDMVRAYLADRLTAEHAPALIEEAQNLIDILEGGLLLDSDEDYRQGVKEKRQLERFIQKMKTLAA